jgi:uncharacterized protein (DUF4415 family)
MPKKKPYGTAEWTDPDDAPEITDAFFDRAEIRDGNKLIRRGRGRPPVEAPKQQITLRLDADVIAALRKSGPGWSGRVNRILARSVKTGEFAESTSRRKVARKRA